jgi:hypothetical protein
MNYRLSGLTSQKLLFCQQLLDLTERFMQFVRKPFYMQEKEMALGKARDERTSAFLKCLRSCNSDEDWEKFEIADLNWQRVSNHHRLTGENPEVV